MIRGPELWVEIWRGVAQAQDLSPWVERLLALLESELPPCALSVHRLETERSLLRPLAFATAHAPAGAARAGPREIRDMQGFLAWCLRTEEASATLGELPAGLATIQGGERRLFTPLVSAGRVQGLAEWDLAAASRDADITSMLALREPLSVALANQERVRELSISKETAEADRRSLLSRLGRDELREPVVGASAGLKEVFERVQLVARTDAPVLLLGETGSGKEVVARALHDGSPLADRPFLRVNCGAIPPQLIDSELFGHERGSFTGANQTWLGWFERAHRGTLFLDE
ncbi:MAG TPA: sigma 54-interacting transcriptional regulator, partial [Planctomycetota bacterium]|nr:sigma 54-interacting transcriptional regulator [Planctomycetota bacterium]